MRLVEVDMTNLGIYQTRKGEEYDCYFISNNRIAKAIGPLPSWEQVGWQGPAFEVSAESKQEAMDKLAEKIAPGKWC